MAWTAVVNVAVGNTVKAQIDSGGAAARLEIYQTTTNTLLGTIPLAYPCGNVGSTGQLTIQFGATQNAVANGTAQSAVILTSTGVPIEDGIPCQAGSSPVSGRLVLSSLAITAGTPITGVSFTIG